MAAEVVAGAFLSSFLNVVFDRLSKPEVVNWIKRKKLDKKLLDKLETSLLVVRAVLNGAEKKQITDPDVKKWLSKLQHAVYVADDLLDEVSTKAATQKDPGNFLSQSLNSEDREMVANLEEVINSLESLASDKAISGLKEVAGENMSWRESTSLVNMSDVYGRDKEREDIVKLLLDDNTSDGEISVIPIVGMGGIGKTTLAQLVYNDDRVNQKFDFKKWVCVGEKFDVLNISKSLLEAGTSSSCNVLESVQLNLKNKLTGKKFLVVLDDMWSDSYDDWKNFLNPFQFGSAGSKILVTTRVDEVASVVKTIQTYQLDLLSDECCWLVFAKHAFRSTESRDRSALEKVGRKIVEKCKRLPLAAKTLGGLLRRKENVKDWDDVLKSEIWDFPENESRILPALRVSYHCLPSYLKRCFVHCSLYPKDYEFDIKELVSLWMAEDLLHLSKSTGRGRTLEEIGCKYFNDLVSRSFFQPSNSNDKTFVMHDLMHDLAIFYAGEFYFRASELRNAAKVDIKTRHLSYNYGDNDFNSKFFEACGSLKHVRTLLSVNLPPFDLICGRSGNFFLFHSTYVRIRPCFSLSQMKCLRFLSLRGFSIDDSLCNSICELIHLRYLDLSYTPIVTLPESLSYLYNLQTLKLNGCFELKMLPNGMQNLVNLYYLDLSNTPIVRLPESLSNLHNLQTLKLNNCSKLEMLPSRMQDLVDLRHLDIRETDCLKEMPRGTNKLKDLHFLSDYTVGKHEENGIKELGALTSLCGTLTISNLQNVGNSFEASEARMFEKERIDVLNLSWSSDEDGGDIMDSQTEVDILDKLRPYTDLKVLSIEGYRGTKFPDWLGDSSYHNMTTMKLMGCRNCWRLPSLGHLPSLKNLQISGFDKLLRIGGDCLPASLQELEISKCKKLEFPMQQQQQYESLRSLEIDDSCDSLTSFPLAAFPNLEELNITRCANMKYLDEVSQSQQEDAPLPSLSSLSIGRFPSFVSLLSQSRNAALPILRVLNIWDCPSLVSLSTIGLIAPQLEGLDMSSCPEIDSLTDGEEGLPPNLRHLRIFNCKKLVRWLQASSSSTVLHNTHSLTHLEIGDACDSIKSFPKEDCLPFSLKSLFLGWFPNLEMLDCNGLVHLTSLQELRILDCPKLENMARERLPPSLKKLSVARCPLLGERFNTKDPQIWPKVSHIPEIIVDARQIS